MLGPRVTGENPALPDPAVFLEGATCALRLRRPSMCRWRRVFCTCALLLPACCAALLDPLAAPRRAIAVNSAHSVTLHEPEDDAIMEARMANAHAAAVAAGPESYDEVMENYCSEQPPAYWAQLWPSALAMGRWLLEEPDLVAGRSVLELGCGLGLASTCAALAGAEHVCATDIDDDALRFAAANAAANGVAEVVETCRLDWKEAADTAAPMGGRQFDVVLVADCIYDEVALPLLARLLPELCSRDGGGVVIYADNADRPYKAERRESLLSRLCDGEQHADSQRVPQFESERGQRTTRVELKSRQGDEFDVVLGALRRTQLV